MNKQQAYFEKEVIPYRQKIRQLESESKDIRFDNYTLKSMNEDLKNKLDKKENEIQNLLTIMNMSDEDRKVMLKREKSTQEFSSMFNALSRAFH
jgi:predicted RNase H-like nuclease (RuvC/YqgF family)